MKVRRYKGSVWPRGGKPHRGPASEWSRRDERGRMRDRIERDKRNEFGTVVVPTFIFFQ